MAAHTTLTQRLNIQPPVAMGLAQGEIVVVAALTGATTLALAIALLVAVPSLWMVAPMAWIALWLMSLVAGARLVRRIKRNRPEGWLTQTALRWAMRRIGHNPLAVIVRDGRWSLGRGLPPRRSC